jgi:hypothetical protein
VLAFGVLSRQGVELRDAKGRWLPGVVPRGARPWHKGQVPNPSGKGGLYHEMQRLARDFTPQGALILRGIASDPNEDSRNRIVAIGMLLDRAWGKVPDHFDPAAEQQEDDRWDPRAYSPEELERIEDALRLIAEGRTTKAAAARRKRGKAAEPEVEILPPGGK